MWKDTSEELAEMRPRLILVLIILATAFGLLLLRLWYLQIFKGHDFRYLSEHNRIRLRIQTASRGTIYDSQGVMLAADSPIYNLVVYPSDVEDPDLLLTHLSNLLGIPKEALNQRYAEKKSQASYKAILLKGGLSRDEVAILESFRYELPGVQIEVKPTRLYPFGPQSAHALGYVGEISKRQLESPEFQGRYRQGDNIGKQGIEKIGESYLKGIDGGQQLEVDALGREIRVLNEVEETPGRNIHLSLDADIQKQVWEALGEEAGAAVAIDTTSGRIIVFLSKPAFDPNIFSQALTREIWKEMITNPNHPLENKACRGQYPPGSVFKVVDSIANLEEGGLDPNTSIGCSGGIWLGSHRYRCWKEHGHGMIAFHRGLVESCDVYFYTVGMKLGIDRIARYANLLGLGKKTGLEGFNELPGLIPSTKWKRQRFHENFYTGDLLSAAIGQGYVLLTPLQAAVMMATLGSGGQRYRPYLIDKVTSVGGKVEWTNRPVLEESVSFDPENLALVKAALEDVVNQPNGTGWRARIPQVKVAGKTGTAQVFAQPQDRVLKKEDVTYHLRDHAWFAAYAPSDRPLIAVAVLVEHAGHGGEAAAPIAKLIIDSYLRKKGLY